MGKSFGKMRVALLQLDHQRSTEETYQEIRAEHDGGLCKWRGSKTKDNEFLLTMEGKAKSKK